MGLSKGQEKITAPRIVPDKAQIAARSLSLKKAIDGNRPTPRKVTSR